MDDRSQSAQFISVRAALGILLSLLVSLVPALAFAQTLTASKTTASPLEIGHAVTLTFTPGPDTGAFQFTLYSAAATRTSAISGSIANGSVQCVTPGEFTKPGDYNYFSAGVVNCVALANTHGVDLGTGTITILFDIGPATGVMGLHLNFYAFDQEGSYEQGAAAVDGEIVVSGAPTALTAITAGGSHTCGLIAGGAALCWGSGYNGQLGNSFFSSSTSGVRVTGLSSGVSSLAAGGIHSCSLSGTGSVKCWGDNSYGQLGDTSNTSRSAPVAVSGLGSGASGISAGFLSSCAVVSGGVKCWGWNGNGQLGDNSTTNRNVPVAATGLSSGMLAVSAGTFHSCALTTGNAVKCWGNNFYGQLGNNSTFQSLVPVNVVGLTSGVTAIAAGSTHSCAIVSGGARCWGNNDYGQLGDNSSTARLQPVAVSGLSSGVTAIATGNSHSCAIVTGGIVKCWGRNDSGQLGDNSTSTRLIPVAVVGLGSGVVALTAGSYHTCARTGAGVTRCWGDNYSSQLGSGNQYVNSLVPADVSGLSLGQPSITIANSKVVEGSSGTATATFTVSLSTAYDTPVLFNIGTSNGTASSDGDYVERTLYSQSITAGQTSYTFSVTINGDAGIELDETFNVTLSNVSGATVADGQAVGTILDDDDVSCRFIDDAETGPGSWLASGSGAGSDFTLVTTAANSPTHSWFVPGPAQVADRRLTLAVPISLAASTSPVLEFMHRYQLENGYDGAVLEYSTDGGTTWQDILAGNGNGVPANAGRFLAGGYVQLVSNGFSNALGGRQAWTGNAASFQSSQVDLADFAGRSLLLRFRLGTDTSTAASGWWIDDIRVATNSGCIGPSLSIADVTVTEGDSGTRTANFVVSLGQISSMPVSFDLFTSDGTAQGDSDYIEMVSIGRTIPAGQTSTTVGVTVKGDTELEADETFQLMLGNASGAGITDGSAIGRIVNDDFPLLSIQDVSRQEGSNGSYQDNTHVFLVSLDRAAAVPVTFNIATANVTATSGSDYIALDQPGITIYPGQTGRNFYVNILGDTAIESDETYTLAVSNVQGAIVVDGSAAGTIIDDDTPGLSISDVSVIEGDSGTKIATFTASVSLNRPTTEPVGFALGTMDGTATAGSDYSPVSLVGQSIAAGETSKTFNVTLIGDTLVEPDETFSLVASNITAGKIIRGTALGKIFNDDAMSLSISDVSVAEGNSGTSTASFTVSQSLPSSVPLTFDIATANGTATAGSDYAALSVTGLSIPAGQTSMTFAVSINGDTVVEPDETFTVGFGNIAGASAGSVQVAASESYSCTVLASGALQCWGYSGSGQFGNGNANSASQTPITVIAGGVAKVSTWYLHACAVLASGALQCWGNNNNGQVGTGSTGGNVLMPTTVIAGGVVDVSTGGYHTCAVLQSGALQCWGENSSGQIGNGGSGKVATPTTVIAAGVTQVSAGYSHTCAVASGALRCWGYNGEGQIGNGSSGDSGSAYTVPAPLTVIESGVTQVAAGYFHTCAVLASGALQCWGSNSTGQLGNGGTGSVLSPATTIAGGVARVSVGAYSSCAMMASGALQCWGYNFSGQVGNGSSTGYVLLPSTANIIGVAQVSVGYLHTCAVLLSKNLMCWGGNDYGQIGNGSTIHSANPVPIIGGGYVITNATATGTITNDDSTSLSIADASVVEGNGGTSQATFTVSLSQPSSTPVAFDIATANGTATSGSDYVALALANQSIPAGQTSMAFAVTINGDTSIEADEIFTVSLANASGAGIADASAIGTIVNDDSLQLSIADASAVEGNSGARAMSFTVSLNGTAPPGGVSFDIATRSARGIGNTAQAGIDYSAANQAGRIIASGSSSTTFVVKVLGDTRVEANETFVVQLSNAVGAVLSDATAIGTINDDDAGALAIAEIQGTGNISPWLGQQVRVQGVVTARRHGGFFLQTVEGQDDGNPASSEAVYVSTEALARADVAVGQHAEVLGTVHEAGSETGVYRQSRTQIVASELRASVAGSPLPRPVVIDASVLNPRQRIDALERYEGMRVVAPRLSVVAPVGGRVDATSAGVVADGVFHVVVDGVARPFREPGANPREVASSRPVVISDGNAERLRVDSLGQLGSRALAVDAGHRIAGLAGVIDDDHGAYVLLLDPAQDIALSAGATPRAASTSTDGEATLGEFVLGRLFDDRDDPVRAEPVSSQQAYSLRLAKTANAVCSYLRSPDILAVSEIENRETLEDLAAAINSAAGNVLFPDACAGNAAYRAYMAEGISVDGMPAGLLVNAAEVRPGVPRVQVLQFEALSSTAGFDNPDGSGFRLHDAPPLSMRVRVNSVDGRAVEFSVLSAALAAVEDGERDDAHGWPTIGERQRARRLAQARDIEALLARRQQANPGERLVLLGAFDALDFDNGREDLLALLDARGHDSPVSMPLAGNGSRPLVNLLDSLPASERYTMVADGDAQAREHILVNRAMLDAGLKLRLEAVRLNADFGADNFGDFSVPVRASERDPLLLHIGQPR